MPGASPTFPSLADVRAIVAWRERFDRPVDELVRWVPSSRRDDGVMTMPYPEYGDVVLAFLRELAGQGFVVVFDWPTWSDEGLAIQRDAEALGAADLTTLCKLLTMHVRADRFTEGHLASCIEHGWLVAILDRLADVAAIAEASEALEGHPLLRNREALAPVGA